MEYTFNYGLTEQSVRLPNTADVSVLSPLPLPSLKNLPQCLQAALEAPLGCPPLGSRTRPRSIAIAVPDETRPVPLKILLPVLIGHINSLWPAFPASQITIMVGGGLHKPADQAQCARILPPEAFAHRVLGHDAVHDKCLFVGTSSRGNDIKINAAFMEADCKIVIGQIDPHQFVGFTGGAKGVVIGCGAKSSIEYNHALMTQTHAAVGEVEDNPVRQDLNEAGEMAGLDLAINVVLNAHKEVVALLVGSPKAVLDAGYPVSAKVYGLELDGRFDMAIASCGGHPKDICLYQAQKGLNLASHCLRDGGRLVLLAACPQGIGDEKYANYVRHYSTPEQQITEFTRNGFRMGAHKAFLFSKTLLRYQVGIVSELDADTLARCMLTKVALQDCVDRCLQELSAPGLPPPRIALIPNANTTFFTQASAAAERVPAEQLAKPATRTRQESTMITHFVVHEPDDSVGVIVLEGVTKNETLNGWIMDGDKSISFTTKDDIPIGHKIALKDMAVGDTVIKYGTDIGKVVKPIKQGEHLHVHNVKTKRW